MNIEFDHYQKCWSHEDYMNMALELSEIDKGYTLPNPWVGCIIINNKGEIISKGRHENFGQNHAEINCINNLSPNEIVNNIYITLEPCSHFGKTGPCVDEIIKLNPNCVYIGIQDPNPIVSGNGIKKLQENNIEVVSNILYDHIYESLKPYIYFNQHKRPFITGKISLSFNHIYADEHQRLILSNSDTFKDTHQLRSQCLGILVGCSTWRNDKPQLNVRYGFKQNPRYQKFILFNKSKDIFNLDNEIESKDMPQEKNNLIFVTFNKEYENNLNNITETNHKYRIWFCKNIDDFICKLYELKIVQLLIEGGNETLNSFSEYLNEFIYYIHQDYVDEGKVFKLNLPNLKLSKSII